MIRVVPLGSAGDVQVMINAEPTVTVSAASFSSIAIYGQAGDDDIEVAGAITRTAFLFGGLGNDRLKGGGGINMLVGGGGNDNLIAGNNGSFSVLIGGTGADRLTGNGGSDLLIGGPVDFEDPSTCANNMMLCNLLHAWADPTKTYADRVAAVAPILSGHVLDDGAVDILQGGSGMDLFYASLADAIRGLHRNEVVITV